MRYLLLRLKRFCGFITGFVFFIGGLLKLLDPVGAGLVMKEYLDFLHIGFLSPLSKPLGFIFAMAESVIGIGLITGVWRKTTGIAAISFQAFFTFLTLLLFIFNPEMDCGCFGEAIHLTHTQTFVKNIILCALIGSYYFPTKLLGQPKREKFISFGIVTASVFIFAIYSLIYIPLVDFTAYKPAAALKAGHAFASEDGDMYEAVFIYEKDGIQEKFELDHLPDSTWTFVKTETVAKEGYDDNNLLDLSFSDANGNYMDKIASEGRVLIVSVYKPSMKTHSWEKTATFIKNAEDAGFKTLILVSGTAGQMDEILSETDKEKASELKERMYFSDYKTLISLNRSNGGITYFSQGYLIRKWAKASMPDTATLKQIYMEDETETITAHNTRGSLAFQGFLLYVSAIMLLL